MRLQSEIAVSGFKTLVRYLVTSAQERPLLKEGALDEPLSDLGKDRVPQYGLVKLVGLVFNASINKWLTEIGKKK